jgi:CHC2 zinc finger
MSYDRTRLPDPVSYYESHGLILKGPRSAKWKTTCCEFHGGSDSMRVNVASGAFKCMACNVGGGDVLAYHMQANGLEFVDAAKALGAWADDGEQYNPQKPTALSPRAALEVLGFEATLVAVAAGNLAQGVTLTDVDRKRLLLCAGRINRIAGEYSA